MADPLGWLSLAPPLVTIWLALQTKRVLPSLLAGIGLAQILLNPQNPLAAPFIALDHLVSIATDPGNFLLILFSLMVGGLLQLIRDGRGFEAFANLVASRGGGKRSTHAFTLGIATTMFLDVWSNVLVNGASSGPLFDRLGLSRLRLAYYMHTVAIAVVAMAVLNGWGAFYIGLLRAQGEAAPLAFIVSSIPYMLYNWVAILLVLVTMVSGLALGRMRKADEAALRALSGNGAAGAAPEGEAGGSAALVIVPILLLIATVFAALWVSGKGDILAGDASRAITYGVFVASVGAAGLLMLTAKRSFREVEESFVGGMSRFFDVGILIVLALALGELVKDLGTGAYISQVASASFPTFLLPALVFVLGAVMSFATGTSYGTFSIMVPIALPLAHATGLDPHLMFGAVISGGLFGDNSSPISDTSIVTSLGAEVQIVDHVATQLPYSLLAAGISATLFVILGFLA
jgi:tetracycline resistance efflux pump